MYLGGDGGHPIGFLMFSMFVDVEISLVVEKMGELEMVKVV